MNIDATQTVARLEAEIAELRRQLDDARALNEERLGQVQRLRADHLNYRRRLEQERALERGQANAGFIITLLPVLDDLDRALASVEPRLAGEHWVQGIEHIARKLRVALEQAGLTAIDADGQPFDPTQHEAITREETDAAHAGRVLETYQRGYRFGGRLLRPAMVKVGVRRDT